MMKRLTTVLGGLILACGLITAPAASATPTPDRTVTSVSADASPAVAAVFCGSRKVYEKYMFTDDIPRGYPGPAGNVGGVAQIYYCKAADGFGVQLERIEWNGLGSNYEWKSPICAANGKATFSNINQVTQREVTGGTAYTTLVCEGQDAFNQMGGAIVHNSACAFVRIVADYRPEGEPNVERIMRIKICQDGVSEVLTGH
jgi:hypothetical protein